MMFIRASLFSVLVGIVIAPKVAFSGMIPAPVKPSGITFQVTHVGTTPSRANPGSPVSVGDDLLFVNQGGSILHRDPAGIFKTIFEKANAPAGLDLFSDLDVLNVTSNVANDKLIVVFTSRTVPDGVPVVDSPRGNANGFQVVYSFDYNGAAEISNPKAIVAYEVFTGGRHTGGGLVTLANGDVLFAVGDNGNFGQDGREFPQDDSSHIGKILRINPETGDWFILAKGVRNPQQIIISEISGEEYFSFVDIGGDVAEELNTIPLADLLDDSVVENFGWGRNADDNLSREGTFYIDFDGNYSGIAPVPDLGFVQPIAQWGREDLSFTAGSGPISHSSSFIDVDFLFGDLVSGRIYATQGGVNQVAQDVFDVTLIDENAQVTSLSLLANGRPDPRFFVFPDGQAGVLLERTGDFYLLTQVSSVPEPRSILLVLVTFATLLVAPRLRKSRSTNRIEGHSDGELGIADKNN